MPFKSLPSLFSYKLQTNKQTNKNPDFKGAACQSCVIQRFCGARRVLLTGHVTITSVADKTKVNVSLLCPYDNEIKFLIQYATLLSRQEQ